VVSAPDWEDYALLDSGQGRKLERYGPYIFVRPEPQAVWRPALPPERWRQADATFKPTGGESGGEWVFHRPVEPAWGMEYKGLKFNAQTRDSRLMGVLPEQAAHWDWIEAQVHAALRTKPEKPPRVLNLFAYTGLATLAAARAGAHLTHVDASRRAIKAARANQALSGLEARPIRWLVEDAQKFVEREVRRGSQYEGLILDPPKFGRGPKGQVWEFFKSTPRLLENCRRLLSPGARFVVFTAYAIPLSSLGLHNLLAESLSGLGGAFEAGELALVERSAGRRLFSAIFARWSAD
jgi:23S rRNA (cytosine1962-C5)-methyltransferase